MKSDRGPKRADFLIKVSKKFWGKKIFRFFLPKSKIFKVFLETTFVRVSCYPDHYEPKTFFSVFEVRYTILDSRVPSCNAISEGRLPLCSSSSEARALPSEVRIEDDSDRKIFKPKFFQSFSRNYFFSRFMLP